MKLQSAAELPGNVDMMNIGAIATIPWASDICSDQKTESIQNGARKKRTESGRLYKPTKRTAMTRNVDKDKMNTEQANVIQKRWLKKAGPTMLPFKIGYVVFLLPIEVYKPI